MNEVWRDLANLTYSKGSIPPSLHHYNNKEVEMSVVVRTSDDRVRGMKTTTTRKDKSDEESQRNKR